MNYFFFILLFAEAIISFYYASRIIYKVNLRQKSYRLFAVTAAGCGLWCLGYAIMILTEDDSVYLTGRAIDIVGLVIYFVFAQIMLGVISGKYKKFERFFYVEVIGGVAFLALMLDTRFVYLKHTKVGIVPYFNNGFVDAFYNIYVSLVMIALVVLMLALLNKNNKRSIRVLGYYCMAIEAVILLGTILDTALPLLGVDYNLPLATSGGFIGLCILYFAMHLLNRNVINFSNITAYVLKSFKSPMMVFDENNNLQLFNETAGKLFSITDENKTKIDIWREILKIDVPAEIDKVENSIEIECELKEKGLFFRLYIDPIFNDYKDYIGYIVVASDTTLVNEYIRKSEESRKEAIAANHSKSMFLANMSHEIRTPMNSILSFSQLALNEKMADNLREYFTDIRDSATSLLSIINDILNISKIESGKMELVNEEYYPAKIFKEVSVIIGMQAENKGLELRLNIDKNIPNKLEGDKNKIREILINLLNNSIKYTKTGYVSLEVLAKEMTGDGVELVINVKDSGIGIKKDDLENIFDKFKRVDEKLNSATEGTGLGLSITKGFVDLMGGTINIESIYGVGTIFSITLPQKVIDASPMVLEQESEAKDNRQLKMKNVTILAVDDNKINLKVDAKFLSRYGAEFDLTSSGQEAIDACKNKEYDIVLMDQMMPLMDGVTAMKNIRAMGGSYAISGKSKIIALTANVIEGVREELIREGFDDFLGKPIDFKEFERVVVEHLPEEFYYYEEEE